MSPPNLLASVLMFIAACSSSAATPPSASPPDSRVEIRVDGEGFHPDHVSVPAGRRSTLVFTRTTDQTCATEVAIPSLHVRRALPLQQPVEIPVTPAAGTTSFACGMDMLHGEIVAR